MFDGGIVGEEAYEDGLPVCTVSHSVVRFTGVLQKD